jgi:septum site-determining protein MinD
MLAIAGGKGGCGKTTTTLGLAAALGRRGAEPLVIDGDCDMPDVHHRLEMPRGDGVDALARGRPLRAVATGADSLPGVHVVQGGRRRALDTALGRARQWDGPILVDCGAGTNPDAVTPLRHAERAVVVSTNQPQCIEDAETTRQIARRLSTTVTGVVVRRSDPETTGGRAGAPRSRLRPEWTVLGEIPSVDAPLEDDQVTDVFQTVAASVYPPGSTGEPRRRTYRGP